MNWVDVVIILLLAMYALLGWRRGFLSIAMGFFVLAVSIGLAALLYKPLTPLLQQLGLSPNFAKAISFIILWFGTQAILSLAGRRLYKRIGREARASTINRAAGVLPGMIEGLVLIAFVALLLVAVPNPGIPKEDIKNSAIGRPLIKYAACVEQSAANVFGEAIQDALSFITVRPEPTSTERITLKFKTTDVSINEAAEARMLLMVNRERTKRGLDPLVADTRLRGVARSYAKDMFAKGYFSHVGLDGRSPFDRMKDAKIRYLDAGENLALAPTVDIAHTGLMNSPGHRENILSSRFGRVGIGVISSDVHGAMFVQEFTN